MPELPTSLGFQGSAASWSPQIAMRTPIQSKQKSVFVPVVTLSLLEAKQVRGSSLPGVDVEKDFVCHHPQIIMKWIPNCAPLSAVQVSCIDLSAVQYGSSRFFMGDNWRHSLASFSVSLDMLFSQKQTCICFQILLSLQNHVRSLIWSCFGGQKPIC